MEGFDGLLELEVVELGADTARGRLAVREELRQPDGAVHPGVYASVAASLAAPATALSPERKLTTAISTQTNVLRSVRTGTIDAIATPKHRGRTTWVWEVEF